MRRITVLLIVTLIMVTVTGSAYAGTGYKVRFGDNLYKISRLMGVNHEEIMAANDLGTTVIYPGQVLKIPSQSRVYEVKKGDTLFRIARKYKISLNELMSVNGMNNTLIFPGQNLIIPGKKRNMTEPAMGNKVNTYISQEDIELLARLIHAEARGEDDIGKLAVGAVILNRLASDRFPDSIREIIYQKTNGVYQFTPVSNGTINMEPSEAAIKAAQEAIEGKDPTSGALFFYNPKTSTDNWIRTLPVTRVIGNHVFAK